MEHDNDGIVIEKEKSRVYEQIVMNGKKKVRIVHSFSGIDKRKEAMDKLFKIR